MEGNNQQTIKLGDIVIYNVAENDQDIIKNNLAEKLLDIVTVVWSEDCANLKVLTDLEAKLRQAKDAMVTLSKTDRQTQIRIPPFCVFTISDPDSGDHPRLWIFETVAEVTDFLQGKYLPHYAIFAGRRVFHPEPGELVVKQVGLEEIGEQLERLMEGRIK